MCGGFLFVIVVIFVVERFLFGSSASRWRKKVGVNRRCVDCGALINPVSTRCSDCAQKAPGVQERRVATFMSRLVVFRRKGFKRPCNLVFEDALPKIGVGIAVARLKRRELSKRKVNKVIVS